MNDRTTRIVLLAAAFVAGLVLCFTLVMLVKGRIEPPAMPVTADIGGPFSLTDQDARTVTEADMTGKPFLVFFGFTHCPEVCPTTLFQVSQVMQKLGPDADKMRVLFITLDPERDTAAVLKDYMSNFDPHMTGLRGDSDAVAKVAKNYRVIWRKVPLEGGDYTLDHTAIVYLMGKDGRFISRFDLSKRSVEAAAADLRKYL